MSPDDVIARDGSQELPDPPYEADVYLGGFDRVDMPIDWLSEDWALEMSNADLGALFRLYCASLRQSPAGSLPGEWPNIAALVPGLGDASAAAAALRYWPVHADGRRYWSRVQPVIEDAWGRRRGKTSKEAVRKRRERLRDQLIKCGLTKIGATNADVQALVFAEMAEGERLTFRNVHQAAERAGVIGAVRPLGRQLSGDKNGQSETVRNCPADSSRTVRGQLQDSSRTVAGQFSDGPNGVRGGSDTKYGVGK